MIDDNYIDIKERQRNRYIYRTISFSRLVELFETRQNTLTAPRIWDDPFENFILNSSFDLDGENVKLCVRDKCFGQSWSIKYESDAMWRIYSKDKAAVRIRTTINRLAKSLSSKCHFHRECAFIGRVEYCSEKKLQERSSKIAPDLVEVTGKNMARTLLLKRNAFAHEREIRLLLIDHNGKDGRDLYKYEIDPHQLVDSVAVDPRAPDELVDVYRHYLSSKLNFKGYIVKSKLYSPPSGLIYKLVI